MRFLNKRQPSRVNWYLFHNRLKRYIGKSSNNSDPVLVYFIDDAFYFEGHSNALSSEIKETFLDLVPKGYKLRDFECVGRYDEY